MLTINKYTVQVFLLGLIISLTVCSQAFAAPSVNSVSGTLLDGDTITVSGTGFGANGPDIVVYDNFESGPNGSAIATGTGSATIGKWDRVGGGDNSNPPTYDNTFTHSGNMAFKADYTKKTNTGTDSSAAAFVDGINTGDVFLSYWYYLPTTSSFPCYNGGSCNWKVAWLYGLNTTYDDQVLPVGLPGGTSAPYSSWAVSCNDCYNHTANWFTMPMAKGKWYRVWTWVHATSDTSGYKTLWVASKDAGIKATEKVNWSGQIFNTSSSMFQHFAISPWSRWCNDCPESAARYDDVYMAKGPNARARIEIGNASTYTNCTDLAIATVKSWSDTSVVATVRQGSFANLSNAYLYVFDANGNVNSSGYPLCPTCPNPPLAVH